MLDLDVPRDDNCIVQIVERDRVFWEYIQTGKEPPLDPERDAWLRLAADYRQLDEKRTPYVAELKAIEKKMAEMEQRFLAMMGEFNLAESSGLRISRYLRRGAIDYRAALLHLRPDTQERDLEPFRRKGAEQVQLTLRDDEDSRTKVPFEPEALKRVAGLDYWF